MNPSTDTDQLPPRLQALLVEAASYKMLPSPQSRRLIREAAGLTQAQIAEALGVTGPAVSAWESGHRAPVGERRRAYIQLLTHLAGQ